MIDPHPWTGRFAAAFFAGIVVALYVLIIVYGYADRLEWLKDWQTLVTGLVTTLAAIGTISIINFQIIQTEELARESSQRRNWAARALIAGPLSKVCALELDLLKKLFDAYGNTIVGSNFSGIIVWESISNREVDLLAQCIVDAQPQAAADLSALLGELQIHQARLESNVSKLRETSRIVTKANIQNLALDSVFICARAQRLFHYSRRQDSEYFAKVLSKPVFEQCWQELEDFGLNSAAQQQLDNASDKWLAPINQRSPLPW